MGDKNCGVSRGVFPKGFYSYVYSKYPSARVIGLDINLFFPVWMPPNLELHLGDHHIHLNSYRDGLFDLIRIGHLDG